MTERTLSDRVGAGGVWHVGVCHPVDDCSGRRIVRRGVGDWWSIERDTSQWASCGWR